MKAVVVILSSMLLSGCAESASTLHETKVSELFKVCAEAPRNVRVSREIPVDVEIISFEDTRASYEITLSHYQGDQSRLKGPVVALGGPLDVLVLGTLPDEKDVAYAIAFDSLGAIQPRAFGSITIKSGSLASVDDMFTFLAGLHRCGRSALSANKSFKRTAAPKNE